MTQEQIIKEATALATAANYKGIIIAISDGNFFFINQPSDMNGVINHCKSIKATTAEPVVHMIDFAQETPAHRTVDYKDLGFVFTAQSVEGESASADGGASGSEGEKNLELAQAGNKEALAKLTFEELSTLTVKELNALAAEFGFDPKATKKAEIVAEIIAFSEELAKATEGAGQGEGDKALDTVVIDNMSIEELKDFATTNGFEFPEDVTREALLDIITENQAK